MSDTLNQYLEKLGIRDYETKKRLSEGNRQKVIDGIITHEAGKQFDRKQYKVEEHMKKAGIYYHLKG